MGRNVNACTNCGDDREIVSHGLCQKCLMANRRASEREQEPSWLVGPDRSQNKSQRELNRMRVNFSKMVALLDECPTSNAVLATESYDAVKCILIAAIDQINKMEKLTVNPKSPLTVNSEAEEDQPFVFKERPKAITTVGRNEEES
jgi:hypothetical protein